MSRRRLEQATWLQPIEEFAAAHRGATPRWAIICTYELDLVRLARSVIPVLTRRGRCYRSVVLADAGALERALCISKDALPETANIHGVRLRAGGVFHPKLVLLRAGRHARVCFGSANVTDGGHGGNLELWSFTEHPALIGGVSRFLLQLGKAKEVGVDDAARRSLARALNGIPCEQSAAVWTSLDGSFADRLKLHPERSSKHVTVISPLYASPAGLKQARQAIAKNRIDLFTDAATPLPNGRLHIYAPPKPGDDVEDGEPSYPAKLHAKAYLFQTRHPQHVAAWVGSANFTAQALTKSVSRGGNVELLVRSMLPSDEFAALKEDLRAAFVLCSDKGTPAPPLKRKPTRPKSTILGCELLFHNRRPSLVVHSSLRSGHVVLFLKSRITVKIVNHRGAVSGPAVAKFLAGRKESDQQSLILFQLIGGQRVPIVANVPHAPAPAPDGVHSHASIDALLDDLRGWARPIRTVEDGDDAAYDQEEADGIDESDGGDDGADAEGRRLDDARHQGDLDQLAVKAWLLKRLICRSKLPRPHRDSMLVEARDAVLAAAPTHLADAVTSFFKP